MDRSSILTLITTTYQTDAIKQQVPIETQRDVYCNVSSITRAEWYEAGRAGINPEYKATMFAYDYQGEKAAMLNGVRYGVYRTYLGRNETIELYLEQKAGE